MAQIKNTCYYRTVPKIFFQMSYYSSKDQPPQPSGWSHRTYATDFWAHQAIWQLKDDHDSQQSSAAKKWMVPCITHKWSFVQPFTDVNVLSRFIISSDPFPSKHSFPVHLVRQAWFGKNPCTRAAWGAVLQARQDTVALFTFLGGGKKSRKCV